MVAAANGAIVHDGGASSQPTTLSTLPGPNHDWSVTLKEKIIAKVCLANDAASVFSLDISEPAESFADLEKRFPGKLESRHCDFTNEESVQAALNAIVAKKNRFDGMIANAGGTKHQPAPNFTMDQVKRLFELNVYGSWNCATAAARTFIKLGCKGLHRKHDFISSQQSCPVGPLRRNKGRGAKHDAHFGHGVGTIRHSRQQHLAWVCKDGVDVLYRKGPEMKNYGGMHRLALPQELDGALLHAAAFAIGYLHYKEMI
ncbi:hypothetical protein MY3296_004870 [Beauveria thailandica]